MSSFFNFLVVFGIVYIILRLILRYVLPMLLGHYINKKVNQMGGQSQSSYNKTNQREGSVTIDSTDNTKKHFSKDKGEYIDFEEVK